jgi:hypothetical protein
MQYLLDAWSWVFAHYKEFAPLILAVVLAASALMAVIAKKTKNTTDDKAADALKWLGGVLRPFALGMTLAKPAEQPTEGTEGQ